MGINMKRMICCLILTCICCVCCATTDKEKTDSTAVEKTLNRWTNSLNKRDFSKDMESVGNSLQDAANKTKESIDQHAPEVNKFFKSLGEYLKR